MGAVIEVGAMVAAVIWAAALGRSRTSSTFARRGAIAGAACLVLAHARFWLLVNPVNAAFATWTPAAVPADWTRLRDQWEFTHAARGGPGVEGRGKTTG